MANNSSGNFFLGLFLAIALIISAYVIAGTIKDVKKSGQSITVKGFAERNITSDYAIWRASYTQYSNDQVTAYNKLEANKLAIIAFLSEYGFKESDIFFRPAFLNIIYRLNEHGYSTNIRDGFSLSQSFEINSYDVEIIQKIASESSTLLKQGIELYSYSPEYYYTKINDLKIEMLGEATQDAYMRAQEIAQNSQSEVGKLLSAQQGVFQITPANSTDISDYGMNDVSSLEKSIKAIVTMEYSIK